MTAPHSLAELTFSSADLDAFARDGFIIVRQLASGDFLRRMRGVTSDGLHRRIEPLELEADVHYPGAPQTRESHGGATIRRLKQAHGRDYVFTEWLTSPGLLGRLRP